MPIVRTYHCDSCGTEFEFLHMNSEEPPPPCGLCQSETENAPPNRLAIGGSNAVKAADYAQNMVAAQYGLTDLKTNLREGDTAAPRPQMQTEAGKEMLKTVESGNVWQSASTLGVMDMARAIPKAEKVSVMENFHKGLKANPPKIRGRGER